MARVVQGLDRRPVLFLVHSAGRLPHPTCVADPHISCRSRGVEDGDIAATRSILFGEEWRSRTEQLGWMDLKGYRLLVPLPAADVVEGRRAPCCWKAGKTEYGSRCRVGPATRWRRVIHLWTTKQCWPWFQIHELLAEVGSWQADALC